MKNIKINSTPITATEEFYTLHNRVANLYNDLMERLPKDDKKKLKELVMAVEEQEKLFKNSVEINGRLHAINKGGA